VSGTDSGSGVTDMTTQGPEQRQRAAQVWRRGDREHLAVGISTSEAHFDEDRLDPTLLASVTASIDLHCFTHGAQRHDSKPINTVPEGWMWTIEHPTTI